MADRRLSASRARELDQQGQVRGCRILVQHALRVAGNADDDRLRQTRRSNAEGYRAAPMPDRKRRAALRSLRLLGSPTPMTVY